jgi:hypothetical protein
MGDCSSGSCFAEDARSEGLEGDFEGTAFFLLHSIVYNARVALRGLWR